MANRSLIMKTRCELPDVYPVASMSYSIHHKAGSEKSTALKGKIVRIIRPGYCMGERLLRKAQVIVGE